MARSLLARLSRSHVARWLPSRYACVWHAAMLSGSQALSRLRRGFATTTTPDTYELLETDRGLVLIDGHVLPASLTRHPHAL